MWLGDLFLGLFLINFYIGFKFCEKVKYKIDKWLWDI